MKIISKSISVALILLSLVSLAAAQVDRLQEMTMVVPAQSIARTIEPLLPYKIDFGKNFVGDLYIQSIENIKIKEGKIFFSCLISGKDLKYATKVGKQTLNFMVGEVNLPSRWEVSFKYDKSTGKLLISPYLLGSKDEKDFSQGDVLMNSLLIALGSVEYPLDLNNLNPVKTQFYNQLVTLKVAIADIYAADDRLFIELIPAVQLQRKP